MKNNVWENQNNLLNVDLVQALLIMLCLLKKMLQSLTGKLVRGRKKRWSTMLPFSKFKHAN